MHPFRAAVEARDIDAAVALMTEDVVFHSPVVFKPYQGRETVRPILQAVTQVFEDFRYDREIGADGAADHVLVFTAQVNGKQVEGADFLHVNEGGLIDEFTVMIRPLSGTMALAESMRALLT